MSTAGENAARRQLRSTTLDQMDDWSPPLDAVPRVLTRAQARALGFSRRAVEHRLATGQWRRLLPGVLLTVDTMTERDRYTAALGFAGRGALLSGAAALRTAGFTRVPPPARVLVIVPADNRVESYEWVHVRASPREVTASYASGPRHVDIARAAEHCR